MDITGLVILGFLVFGFVEGVKQYYTANGKTLWPVAEVAGVLLAIADANSDFGKDEVFKGHALADLNMIGVVIVGLIVGGIAIGIHTFLNKSLPNIGENQPDA